MRISETEQNQQPFTPQVVYNKLIYSEDDFKIVIIICVAVDINTQH